MLHVEPTSARSGAVLSGFGTASVAICNALPVARHLPGIAAIREATADH